jgi:DivIVA domain-containing protein
MSPDEQSPAGDVRSPVVLHPDDISSLDFPVAMRGYDRDAVRRRLFRIAADYAAVIRQRDRSQAVAAESADRAAFAEAEAQTSAREVAELTKSSAELQRELGDAKSRIAQLERVSRELDAVRSAARESQVEEGELQRARDRVSELETEVQQLREERLRDEPASVAPAAEQEPAREPDELLGAALRAAEALRTAARAEAQRTLKKARERGAELSRETARQARALEKAREEVGRLRASAAAASDELQRARAAQADAEREAARVKESMQAEVEHTVASLEAQRERVQTVLGNALTEALAALQVGGGDTSSLFEDLSARLAPRTADGDGSESTPAAPTEQS